MVIFRPSEAFVELTVEDKTVDTFLSAVIETPVIVLGETVNMSGRLYWIDNDTDHGIASKPITILSKAPGEADYTEEIVVTTNGVGEYSAAFVPDVCGLLEIWVKYEGN